MRETRKSRENARFFLNFLIFVCLHPWRYAGARTQPQSYQILTDFQKKPKVTWANWIFYYFLTFLVIKYRYFSVTLWITYSSYKFCFIFLGIFFLLAKNSWKMVDIEFKKGFFSGQKHIKLLLVCTNEIAKTQKITLKKICQRSILCCSSFFSYME